MRYAFGELIRIVCKQGRKHNALPTPYHKTVAYSAVAPTVMTESACQLFRYSCEHKILLMVAEVVFLTWLSGKLLLALASTVMLGSESRGTSHHILLSHNSANRDSLTLNLIC
jgi:hypothetical protein